MIQVKGFSAGQELRSALNQITMRLAQKDATLWGPSAQQEACIRLNWIDLPESSRELLPLLDAVSAWSRELKHETFVLCGMGGSSLAPEVISAVYKKPLIVLDSTFPDHIKDILSQDLSRTCFIIGSKSGSTIETASQKIAVQHELQKQGLDPRNHLVVVTDPGSPLDTQSRSEELRIINADPNVGGRFSALSAFGLTPAALIGVDVSILIDDAYAAAQSFTAVDSSVVQVAAALATEKFAVLGLANNSAELPGLGDWIEQLVAESTGKDQKGVLPIVIEDQISDLYPVITFDGSGDLSVQGSLGEQFIFWEWVTALTSYLLQVDPFNQPNVTEAKEKTSALLHRWSKSGVSLGDPSFETENISVFSGKTYGSLTEYLSSSIAQSSGYLAVMAYLHRGIDDEVIKVRQLLETAAQKPTTFGWGPRFLHSTGQFHKGGPQGGSFIQITSESSTHWPIPERDYGFETLIMAQAIGDFEALAARNFPIMRIHLKNKTAGVAELISAAEAI
jgi:glucose-6-phosphate isomerase